MSDKTNNSRFEAALTSIRQLTGYGLKLAVVILLGIVAWRVAWAGFSIDLSKFDFSDLLAMILALFAVAMSVGFYFKSTDSSNQFYDNIYNFTQKTSEILGRIEERFGERLRHLDEGYGRIQSRFDDISKSPKEIEKKVKETEGKEEEEKQKLKDANDAMKKMMDELVLKAKLQEKEKAEFYARLGTLASEKDMAEERIRDIERDRDRMQKQLRKMQHEMMDSVHIPQHPMIEELLYHPDLRDMILHDGPSEVIQKHSRDVLNRYPLEMLIQLRDQGIVNKDGELTLAGIQHLRRLVRHQHVGRG